MTEILTRDADKLHQALAKVGDEVRLSVSRETAEWMARLVDAKVSGHDVVLTNSLGDVTPTQAGQLLGMSRPQVRKLMDDGKLAFRKVGTHHRIPVVSIRTFLAAERERRAPVLAELARLQNDVGLVE
ncbi:MAG: helix-turn-helix domain-containing protein [Candidatus Microthrix sp.]|nr:helix-turn-helix domain-containing protein [Candidatus Microthrix sp.]